MFVRCCSLLLFVVARYVLMDMKLSLLEGDEVQLQEEEHRRRAERMAR